MRAPKVGRLTVGVLDLIEWAFQREAPRLSFDKLDQYGPAYGIEYVLMRRAELGCTVQGGGYSPCHHDADIVAAALACLPVECGGKRMAIDIAELASLGQCPNWMPSAKPLCGPVAWRGTKYGQRAVTEVCHDPLTRWPSPKLTKELNGRWCKVSYSNLARDVAAARRRYTAWFGALLHLRHNLQAHGSLTSFTVSQAMPERAPWRKVLTV